MFVLFYKSATNTEMRKYSLVFGDRHDLGQDGQEGWASTLDVLLISVTFIFFCKIITITLNPPDLTGLL